MFSITVPNVDLPVDLGFTQDFDLKLVIGDDGDVVVCGRHWTLFTTVTQPMADFEAAYGILQQTAMVSCAAAAAAEPPPLDIDDSCMPFDKLTNAVVVALEELVDNSCCPNTRVFAWLYAKHLRAADMDFMDLLQTPAIANMASTALDAWFVRHPMFRAQAHKAQDLLITVLDDYTPSRPWYEPYCHEFERRDDLADALPTWRSALAQLLIEQFRRPGRSSIFDNLPVSMTEWKSGIADSANPLTEWLEEVVDVTGASSDAVWIGDLKCRWKESHYGHDTDSVFSTKLVKAFFAGKQGTEWKETGRINTKVKYGKELAKIPPGDLIIRMNININTNQIKKTSTLEEQDAITKLVQIIETATKQKEDFDKATRDFYTVYDKLKIAIMEACDTGPKLCGTVNSAIKTQKKNS
eukprot:gene32579-biopygen11930